MSVAIESRLSLYSPAPCHCGTISLFIIHAARRPLPRVRRFFHHSRAGAGTNISPANRELYEYAEGDHGAADRVNAQTFLYISIGAK